LVTKWILIVDDELNILTLLENSLRILGDDYKIATASNGIDALTILKQRVFDLVITDYRMAGLDGLELTKRIQSIYPGTRIILMTAYGNSVIENVAARLGVYRYITKPLDIPAFQEMVKEAVRQSPVEQDVLSFNAESEYEEVRHILNKLQTDIDASGIFLTDHEGSYVACSEKAGNLQFKKIASLLGGSIATLLEAGRAIDGKENSACMIYREGASANLFVFSPGRQFLLIMLINRNQTRTDWGTVWSSARLAATQLQEKSGKTKASDNVALNNNLEQEVQGELDKLFRDKGSSIKNPRGGNL